MKLTPMQKQIIQKKMGACDKFKKKCSDTSLYVHPCLSEISEANAEYRAKTLTNMSVDCMIDPINVRDGVKARFFMNILSLAISAGEKSLAFSPQILPMKCLESLLVKVKGWGKRFS
jgi:DNA repair and recombination protein RAD54 and RAD54-like protein